MGQAINLSVKLMSKIGWRVFIIIFLMSVGSLLATVFLLNYSIEGHFQDYIYQERRQEVIELKEFLEDSYQQQGGWQLDRRLLNRYIADERILIYVADSQGNEIYSNLRHMEHGGHGSHGRNGETDFSFEQAEELVLSDNGNLIGHLYWKFNQEASTAHRRMGQESLTEEDFNFLADVNRTLYTVAIVMAIISIIVGLLLSRYITKPLLKMNQMASSIANRDYEVEVEISGNHEIAQLGDSFNQMAERLSYLEQLRKESVSDLAHELRTPVAIIRNYLTAIKDGVFEAKEEIITEMQEELSRLEYLVNGLEQVAEAEEKLLTLDKERLNLKSILVKIINSFKLEAEKRDIELIFNCEAREEEFSYQGDRDSLKTIFNNLLSNAIKYSYQGENVIIELIKKDSIMIKVRNKGDTIVEEDLSFIFERFYRTDKSRSAKTGGTGLGLAVTKDLVEAHGGEIMAESNQSVTTFTVEL